jgi:hypothetical protein
VSATREVVAQLSAEIRRHRFTEDEAEALFEVIFERSNPQHYHIKAVPPMAMKLGSIEIVTIEDAPPRPPRFSSVPILGQQTRLLLDGEEVPNIRAFTITVERDKPVALTIVKDELLDHLTLSQLVGPLADAVQS